MYSLKEYKIIIIERVDKNKWLFGTVRIVWKKQVYRYENKQVYIEVSNDFRALGNKETWRSAEDTTNKFLVKPQ